MQEMFWTLRRGEVEVMFGQTPLEPSHIRTVASCLRALLSPLKYLRRAVVPENISPMAAVARAGEIKVPPGYKLHTENSAHILLPDTNDAFLNPVQEFNRDLSVASIRVWAEERDAMKKQKWLERQRAPSDSKNPSKRRKCSWMSFGRDGGLI